jgi:hypothetical protein
VHLWVDVIKAGFFVLGYWTMFSKTKRFK